mmetsp:Transcript_99029/g.263140  ORF Transcript_99029/g.263140 Transcript_99029/m.263140 type:complete len:391 (-) Transcript_99029:400-1572(-)
MAHITSAGQAAAERLAEEFREQMRLATQGIMHSAVNALSDLVSERLDGLWKAMVSELAERDRLKEQCLATEGSGSDGTTTSCAPSQSASTRKRSHVSQGSAYVAPPPIQVAANEGPLIAVSDAPPAERACLSGSAADSATDLLDLQATDIAAKSTLAEVSSAGTAMEDPDPKQGIRGSSGTHLQKYIKHLGTLRQKDCDQPRAVKGRRRAWSQMLESTGGGLGSAADCPESDESAAASSRVVAARPSGSNVASGHASQASTDGSSAHLTAVMFTMASDSDEDVDCTTTADFISRGYEDFSIIEVERQARERLEKRLAMEADAHRRREAEDQEEEEGTRRRALPTKRRGPGRRKEIDAEANLCSFCQKSTTAGQFGYPLGKWYCNSCWIFR